MGMEKTTETTIWILRLKGITCNNGESSGQKTNVMLMYGCNVESDVTTNIMVLDGLLNCGIGQDAPTSKSCW